MAFVSFCTTGYTPTYVEMCVVRETDSDHSTGRTAACSGTHLNQNACMNHSLMQHALKLTSKIEMCVQMERCHNGACPRVRDIHDVPAPVDRLLQPLPHFLETRFPKNNPCCGCTEREKPGTTYLLLWTVVFNLCHIFQMPARKTNHFVDASRGILGTSSISLCFKTIVCALT
jgi:hypothetical protein